MNYDWDWNVLYDYRWVFVRGALWTVVVSSVSIFLGTILGALWGLLLSTKHQAWLELRWLGFVLADIVRALPLLVLLLFVNYYLPPLIGIHSTFWITIIALTVNLAAFLADVLRGAIAGVPKPLVEAGLALGMTGGSITRRVLLPEALRAVVPSFALLYIHILKMSSLASVIAFSELTHVGGQVSARTFRPLEAIAAVAVIYLILVLPLSHIQRRLETSRWLVRRS